MLTYLCPKGHPSTEADYCSECGAKIQGNSPPSFSQTDPPSSSSPVICPACFAPHELDGGDFCEICGYNFVKAVHGEMPITVSHPPILDPVDRSEEELPLQSPDAGSSLPHSPSPLRWELTITIDPLLRDPASPPPPNHFTPIHLPLNRSTNFIGRTSQSRSIYPEIPLDFDDAVSHCHALLACNSDGSLTLRDLGSSNGTKLNDIELKPMVDAPVRNGDEITLGHWTRIKVTSYL